MTPHETDGTAKVIELRKLCRSFGSDPEVRALVDVDLWLDSGDWLAITGPSGAGKSTLLHLIGCLDRPTSGQYFLDGIDSAALSDSERAGLRSQRIGFVFQSHHLLPQLTALENVLVPLELLGDRPPRETLARLLPTIRHDMTHESDCIRDAGFSNHARMREIDPPETNARLIADFLTIPQDRAMEIAKTDYLFAD